MLAKCFITLAAMFCPLACSSSGPPSDTSPTGGASSGQRCPAANAGQSGGGTAGVSPSLGTAGAATQSDDDALFVPAALQVSPLEGGNGVLDLIALTLRAGPSATEVYVALRNDGDKPACSAGVSIQLFDQSEQSLAASITGLLSNDLYRFTDGTGTIVSCVGPGDTAMGAITDLPADIVIADVGSLVYYTPYFVLDVEPLGARLGVNGLNAVPVSDGTTYTGTVVNGLDFTVSNPAVTVFPVNRVGRPLGAASGSGTADLMPCGTWSFQTNSVDVPGVGAVAYPTATPASP